MCTRDFGVPACAAYAKGADGLRRDDDSPQRRLPYRRFMDSSRPVLHRFPDSRGGDLAVAAARMAASAC